MGIPIVIVPPNQPRLPIKITYPAESDQGPYPIPPNLPIEGGTDHHAIIVEDCKCILYEMYKTEQKPDGTWAAAGGVVFDLQSHGLRPNTWSSVDAAGLPIMPGLTRYEEVAAGAIRHALRFTAPRTRRAFVWPARHYASSLTDPSLPPLGQRFRLKADFDISRFPPQARVILQALKTYGMLLADNGSSWFLSGAPDERWDNEQLATIKQVKGSSFEAVDSTPLMLSIHSGRAAQALRACPPTQVEPPQSRRPATRPPN